MKAVSKAWGCLPMLVQQEAVQEAGMTVRQPTALSACSTFL